MMRRNVKKTRDRVKKYTIRNRSTIAYPSEKDDKIHVYKGMDEKVRIARFSFFKK